MVVSSKIVRVDRHSEILTIRCYKDQADECIRETVGVNIDSLCEPFLPLAWQNERILDAGCGLGRNTTILIRAF